MAHQILELLDNASANDQDKTAAVDIAKRVLVSNSPTILDLTVEAESNATTSQSQHS
jgi:hypothetical protein